MDCAQEDDFWFYFGKYRGLRGGAPNTPTSAHHGPEKVPLETWDGCVFETDKAQKHRFDPMRCSLGAGFSWYVWGCALTLGPQTPGEEVTL